MVGLFGPLKAHPDQVEKDVSREGREKRKQSGEAGGWRAAGAVRRKPVPRRLSMPQGLSPVSPRKLREIPTADFLKRAIYVRVGTHMNPVVKIHIAGVDRIRNFISNTRAVPPVHTDDAHQGRVSYFPAKTGNEV